MTSHRVLCDNCGALAPRGKAHFPWSQHPDTGALQHVCLLDSHMFGEGEATTPDGPTRARLDRRRRLLCALEDLGEPSALDVSEGSALEDLLSFILEATAPE